MRKLLTISILFISLSLQGQNTLFDAANNLEAHISVNQPFYISGQRVWFNVFLYDAKTQRLASGERFMELRLIDRNAEVLIEKHLKVEQGRSVGQFNLPVSLTTDEYLLHLGFQKEAPEQYIYASKLEIYNRQEALSAKGSSSNAINSAKVSEGALLNLLQAEKGTKQKFNYDLVLENATEASVSVLVRKVDQSSSNNMGQAQEGIQNLRSQRPLDLKNVYNQGYLQFDLERVSPKKDSIFPLVFIPESHKQIGFLKSSNDQYTIDLTDLSPGVSTFYFNQFIYRAYIPPDLEWDYEKERYKDNYVPYYEGEMQFRWKPSQSDFTSLVNQVGLTKPSMKDYVSQYANQTMVSQVLASSNAYPKMALPTIDPDSMGMKPLVWKNTEDYAQMDNMAEFLFEIVTGIKAYYTDKRKDIVVLNVDGPYHDQPFMLVNGIPTRDVEKVLNIPIDNVEGVGVIKDHKTRAQYKYNAEALPYGAFANTGLIVIQLKPDVINPFRSDFDQMLKKEVYLKPLEYPNINYDNSPELLEGPDLRTTLLWDPKVELTRRKTNLSFYTSDIPGLYEIVITGVKKGGGLIRVTDTFEVKRNNQ